MTRDFYRYPLLFLHEYGFSYIYELPNPAIGKQDVLKVLFIMAHVNRITIIAIVASIFTIITGFYHIMMVPANNFNATILFLV